MNKLLLITPLLFAANAAFSSSVATQTGQLRLPYEANQLTILSGAGAIDIEASCSNVSMKSIGSGMLNNISEALDAIKDSIINENTGVMLLTYSSPRLYQGIQQLRQASDFTMSLSNATCSDIENSLKQGMEKSIADEKKRCITDSGGANPDCGVGFSISKGVESWLNEKDEFIDRWVDQSYGLSNLANSNQQSINEQSISAPKLPLSIIENAKNKDNDYNGDYSCQNEGKNYLLSAGYIKGCDNIDQIVLGYPVLYSEDNTENIVDSIYTPEQLFNVIFEYYKGIFETVNSDVDKLKTLITDHNSQVVFPNIQSSTLNKIGSQTGASALNTEINTQALIYARNTLDIYINETEKKIFTSFKKNNATHVVTDETYDKYRQAILDKSTILNSFKKGIAVSGSIN